MNQVRPSIENAQSNRTRVLGKFPYRPGENLSVKLPNDTTAIGLFISLRGAVKTTFASGTPVAKAESTMDALIKRFDVTLGGHNTIKSLTPHILHIQNILASGIETERFAAAGAAPIADSFPTTQGGFVFGTTGQFTTVRETVYLPFEMVHCEPGWGRERTWVNLRHYSSSELRMNMGVFADILGTGNTAPVVFSDNTLEITVTLIERQDPAADQIFDIWKQNMVDEPILGESRERAIRLNDGNFLTGLLLFAQDGAAGTATTATGKLASNLLITQLSLKANGRNTIQEWLWKELQNANRMSVGVVAPFTNGASRLDGVAHMNLLNRRQLDTALPAMRPVVDQLQLFIDSNSSGNVSYTLPANLRIVTEELILAGRR